jgi:DMSO/TMAO reductase YedYZ molybdopterin-dependent catalytic subunit
MENRRERVPPGQGVTKGWPLLHVGEVPATPRERWTLRVHGEVERPVVLAWSELLALEQTRTTADFHCVTGWSTFDNAWEGVALATLARHAGLFARARFVRFADPQGYDTTVPLELALREGLLAHRHGGADLAPEHGGPLRAVVPSLYAWKSCKWVCELEFLAAERLGFWEVRGYHNGADPWREERLV